VAKEACCTAIKLRTKITFNSVEVKRATIKLNQSLPKWGMSNNKEKPSKWDPQEEKQRNVKQRYTRPGI
jgi:hypothetical protein